MRKTKVIATIGSLYNDEKTIAGFLGAGADMLRDNMAHNSHEWHASLIKRIKHAIKESGRDIKIESDISGPKVRTGSNPPGMYFIDIKQGDRVVLTTGNPGEGKIYVGHAGLNKLVVKGSRILIDDAHVQLEVVEKRGQDIICKSLFDCRLGGRRSVVIPGKDFGLPSITEKDWKDIEFIARQEVDYLGLSFARSPRDVEEVRQFLRSSGCSTRIISKIETPEGVKNFNSILQASDAIMVARGDMKIFLPMEKIPSIQYEIVRKCRKAGKFVIVATEMMHSMKTSPIPTCAEVNDIYTAVSAGASAVMLSGETAEGKHPLRALECMVKIVEQAEKTPVSIGV